MMFALISILLTMLTVSVFYIVIITVKSNKSDSSEKDESDNVVRTYSGYLVNINGEKVYVSHDEINGIGLDFDIKEFEQEQNKEFFINNGRGFNRTQHSENVQVCGGVGNKKLISFIYEEEC